MKRRSMIAACIAACFVVFAACQPNPTDVVVIHKDTERMVEQAGAEQGTKIETILGDKKRIELHATGLDGRLAINVEAAVHVPGTDYMPILRVMPGFFTQESVSGIFNFLFPSQKPYDLTGSVPTKEDYEADLLRLKQQLSDGSYQKDGYSEEDFLSVIADTQALYDAAPTESQPPKLSEGQMGLQRADAQSGESGDYWLTTATDLTPGATTKYFSVRTPDANNSAKSGDSCLLSYHDAASPNYSQLGMQRIDTMDSVTDVEAIIGLPYEQAKKLCFDLFKAAHTEDQFIIGAAFMVSDQSTGLHGTWENGKYVKDNKAAQNYAYQIFLTRSEGGIPELVNTDASLTGDEVSIPWGYEYICFTIDQNGIQNINWQYPSVVTDTVVEHATLKPYSEIEAIFQDMIKIEYEAMTNLFYGEKGKMEVNVDDVQLCLVRIREQGGSLSGLLVPAWVFYGHNVGIDADGNQNYDHYNGSVSIWPKAPIVLITINAIDGTIIDLAKGY